MKRVIVSGTVPQHIRTIIEEMMNSDNKHIIFGGRMHSKNFASEFQKKCDDAVENIPFELADRVKDKEGYVEIGGIGKIHIQNWKDKAERDQKKESENHAVDAMAFAINHFMRNDGMIDFGDGDLIPVSVMREALQRFGQGKTFEMEHSGQNNEMLHDLFKEEIEERKVPFGAFQRRFTRGVYKDPNDKIVSSAGVYDQETGKHYSDDEFGQLMIRVHKVIEDCGGNPETICDHCLNSVMESIEEADAIKAKEDFDKDNVSQEMKTLRLVYDRMVNVHKEDPNVDYMINFKSIIND